MRLKRTGAILLALLLLSLLPHTPAAGSTVAAVAPPVAVFTLDSTTYQLNGERRTMDAAPALMDGRTLVPVRYLAYALGLTDDGIAWDSATRAVTLSKGSTTLRLWAGSRTLAINGHAVSMDAAPVNIPPGRLALPARAFAEAFGYRVEWDAATRSILVRAASATADLPAGSETPTLPTADPATAPDVGAAPVWPQFATPGTPVLGADTLTLQWPAAFDDRGIDAYRITQDGSQIATLPGVTTHYQVTGLQPGRGYRFVIEAVDFVGNASVPLNLTARTIPRTASQLQVTAVAVSGREVVVTYSAPLQLLRRADAANGFFVTRNGRPVGISSAVNYRDRSQVQLALAELSADPPTNNILPGPDDQIAVSYQPGAVQDQAGHQADPLPATLAAYKSSPLRALSARTRPLGGVSIVFAEPLDSLVSPSPANFTINVNGTTIPPENWPHAFGNELLLDVPGISQGDRVSVSYTPGPDPVIDAQYNAALPFTDLPVTNNTIRPQPDWSVAGDGLVDGAPVRCRNINVADLPALTAPSWKLQSLSRTDCLTALTAAVSPDGYLRLSGTVGSLAHWSVLALQVNPFSQLPFSNTGRFHWNESLIPITGGQFQVSIPLSGPMLRTVKLLGVGPGYLDRTELASAVVDVTSDQMIELVLLMDPRVTLSTPSANNVNVTGDTFRLTGTLTGDLAETKQLHITLAQYTNGPTTDCPTPNLDVTAGRFDAAIPLPGGPGSYMITVETIGQNGKSGERLFWLRVNSR